jgi:hypothetical protein
MALFARHFDVGTKQREICELVVEGQINLERVVGALGAGSVNVRQHDNTKHHDKSHE